MPLEINNDHIELEPESRSKPVAAPETGHGSFFVSDGIPYAVSDSGGTHILGPEGELGERFSHTVLTTSASDFQISVPAHSWRFLRLVLQLRSNNASTGDSYYISFNGVESGGDYYYNWNRSNFNSPVTSSGANSIWVNDCPAATNTASLFSYDQYHFVMPTVSNMNFQGIGENYGVRANGYYWMGHVGWRRTETVNTIRVWPSSGTQWLAGSTATLIGSRI